MPSSFRARGPRFDRHRSKAGHPWPGVCRIWPKLVGVGRKWPKGGWHRSEFRKRQFGAGRDGPNLVDSVNAWPRSAQNSTNSASMWADGAQFGRIGRNVVGLGVNLVDIDEH